jgi:hypothetical protein
LKRTALIRQGGWHAFVFISHGREALFLGNAGDETYPNPKTERVFVDENPPSHEQGMC